MATFKAEKGNVGHFDKAVSHGGESIWSIDTQLSSQRFATGGGDCVVRVWSLTQKDESVGAELLTQLSDHVHPVNCVRFSPNGKYLATSSEDIIVFQLRQDLGATKIFGQAANNKETWKSLGVLKGHKSDIFDMAWAPSGNFLATCSMDNTILIWKLTEKSGAVPSFTTVHVLNGHVGAVKGLAWDPIDRFLASQGDDKKVILWRTSDWKKEHEITCTLENSSGESFVRRLCWVKDGSHLVISSANEKGQNVGAMVSRGSFDDINSFTFLVGPKKPITCSKCNHKIFQDKEGVKQFIIATGGQDKGIAIWNSNTHQPILVANFFFEAVVTDLAWASDGSILLAVSLDGSVGFIDIKKYLSKQHLLALEYSEEQQLVTEQYGENQNIGDIIESPLQLTLERKFKAHEKEKERKKKKAMEEESSSSEEEESLGSDDSEESSEDGSQSSMNASIDLENNSQIMNDGAEIKLDKSQIIRNDAFFSGPLKNKLIPMPKAQTTTHQINKSQHVDSIMTTQGLVKQTTTVLPNGKKRVTPIFLENTLVTNMAANEPMSIPIFGGGATGVSSSVTQKITETRVNANESAVVPQAEKSKKKKRDYLENEANQQDTTKAKKAKQSKTTTNNHMEISHTNNNNDFLNNNNTNALAISQEMNGGNAGLCFTPLRSSKGRARSPNRLRESYNNNNVQLIHMPSLPARLIQEFKPNSHSKSKNILEVFQSNQLSNQFTQVQFLLVEATTEKSLSLTSKNNKATTQTIVWKDIIKNRATAINVNNSFIAVGCQNGDLYLFSHKGRRLCNCLVLGPSPISKLEASPDGSLLMVISADGKLTIFKPKEERKVLKVTLEPLLANSMSKPVNISKAEIYNNGKVLIIAQGKAFTYHQAYEEWIRIVDTDFPYSEFHSSLIDEMDVQKGILLRAKLLTQHDLGKDKLDDLSGQARAHVGHDGAEHLSVANVQSISHLENQLLASIAMESEPEFLQFFNSYISKLTSVGFKEKLSDFCDFLIGPLFIGSSQEENQSKNWNSKILGIRKRQLLGDVLPSISLNRALQTLTVKYTQLLEQLEKK